MTREKVREEYINKYGIDPAIVIKAPGRINLIGEHTDYNLGFVLPAAIDRVLYIAMGLSEEDMVKVHALDIDDYAEIPLYNWDRTDRLWVDYIKGILKQLADKDVQLRGANCVFGGTIPIGSGLSSSAALDCGFIKALSTLYDYDMADWDIVSMSNRSNNQYLGIGSGILDQFASVFGKKDQCMLLDCSSREYTYHDINLVDIDIVLINTNVKHEHSSSGYNNRPAECQRLIQHLNDAGEPINSLRDLDRDTLDRHRDSLPDKLYNRGSFIIDENDRVHQFVVALAHDNYHQLGQLLYASHEGLSGLYDVSCEELDLLVRLARQNDHVLGARMMGGGFGGCTINLIRRSHRQETIKSIMDTYQTETGVQPEYYDVSIIDGVAQI